MKDENHKCENPKYAKSKQTIEILGKLKYLCKNCKKEIYQAYIEDHLKEGCIKNDKPIKLIDEIYRKKSLKKLNDDEIKKLPGKNINHISGK